MNQISLVDMPIDVWKLIISKIDDRHLEPLFLVSTNLLSITNRHKQVLIISDRTSNSVLPSLFRRFPNLKHLSFSDLCGDPAPILLQIANFNLHLESLDLSNQKSLPVEALRRFPASVLGGVKSLNIRSVSELDDDDLAMIPTFFPNLEELDLSLPCYGDYYPPRRRRYSLHSRWYGNGDKVITNDGISVLASKLNGLRKINLQGNRWLSDQEVISLSKNCPNLEVILLRECTSVTNFGIGFALQTCKNLNTIGIGFNIDDICPPLCCAPSLSEIVLCHSDISDASLHEMAASNLPLKSVTLSQCYGFTFGGLLSFLKAYNSLNHLALEEINFLSDKAICHLAKHLAKVRVLKLNHCENLSDLAFFGLIKLCPLLKEVEMKETSLGRHKKLQDFMLTSQIGTLNLTGNEHLSDKSLTKIASACPDLETLIMGSCPSISSTGVVNLFMKCHHLKHLGIAGCLGVKKFDLRRNTRYKLELLGACKSGLNDEALIDILKKCPDLVILALEGCTKVSSKGVKEVVDKCTKLKEVKLADCVNLGDNIVPWMVFCKPNLRKISPPSRFVGFNEGNLYLRHGCYVDFRDYITTD